MRLTNVLNSLHIGNTFKKHWEVQRKRKIVDFGVKKYLESKRPDVKVVNACELLGVGPVPPPVPIPFKKIPDGDVDESLLPKPVLKNQSHPDWHDKLCRVFHQHTSLFCGLDEALNLTKCNMAANSLPQRVESLKTDLGKEFHNSVQRAIMTAHLLDATQIKLPANKRTYGEWGRPHPREYGLSKKRRNSQLLTKLFHICDTRLAREGLDPATQSQLTSELSIKAPLNVDGESVMFDLRPSILSFNRKRLAPYADESIRGQVLSRPMPSIYPLNRLLSIFETNIYRLEHRFPLRQGPAPYDGLSMAVFNFNMPFTKQSVNQRQGRLLGHAFGVAAAYAQRLYGEDVTELPEPLTLNCLQTDSQEFLFGAIQLHSLDLNGGGDKARNLFWLEEPLALFAKCAYVQGQPVLEGYDPRVAETLMAVYRSQYSP